MRKILIICKSNKRFGTGHITRAKTIYNEIKNKFKVRLIKNEQKNIYNNYDVLIFDLPSYKNFLQSYNYKNQKIICLDYNGKYKIDLNFSSVKYSKNAKINNVSIKNIICEQDYKLKKKKKKYILISLGGSDPKNYTKKILLKLLKIGNYQIKVVLGKLNFNSKNFEKYENKKISILKNPKNFKKLQSECNYAITNGGMTLCEMINLNKNVFAIPKHIKEYNFCKLLQKEYNLKFGKIEDLKITRYKYKKKIKLGNKEFVRSIISII